MRIRYYVTTALWTMRCWQIQPFDVRFKRRRELWRLRWRCLCCHGCCCCICRWFDAIYIIRHTSYIIHHTSYIMHHTSQIYIIHHTLYIIHQTSYILLLWMSALCLCVLLLLLVLLLFTLERVISNNGTLALGLLVSTGTNALVELSAFTMNFNCGFNICSECHTG